jgi:hypothetical protein
MDNRAPFQMVCDSCGGIQIKIDDPEGASREAIVYCGRCGVSRGTLGALRKLASGPNAHLDASERFEAAPLNGRQSKARPRSDILEHLRKLQALRRTVQRADSPERTAPKICHSSSGRMPGTPDSES